MKKLLPSGLWLALLFMLFCVLSLSWQPIALVDNLSASYLVDQTPFLTANVSETSATEYSAIAVNSPVVTYYPDWVQPVIEVLSWSSSNYQVWSIEGQQLQISQALVADIKNAEVTFLAPDLIQINDFSIHTSPWGSIYIGSDALSNNVNSRILEEAYFYQPWWSSLAVIGLSLIFLVAMHYVSRRESTISVWLIVLLFPIILATLTWYLSDAFSWWIPTFPIMVGCLLSLPYYLQRQHSSFLINDLGKKTNLIRSELFQQYMDLEQYDIMLRQLTNIGFNSAHKEQIYELGLAFERKRSFDKASKVYQQLNKLGGHSDSLARVEHLKKATGQASDLPNMQQTLVLDNGTFELPQLGRYHIIKEIGRGSMGVVYLAKDPKIDRDIALKTIQLSDLDSHEVDSVKQRFFKEAQAAGRLNHPNIVTVYDVGEEKDIAYIAMDFVKGDPLSKYTKEGELLDYKELLDIMAKVSEALKFAHDHRVVHRDIKPSNILYDKSTKTVKVSDFGIARIADNKQTQTGIVMGSPSFMSPEQIRGEHLTGKSDIFSLGVSLYQLLTGKLPFKGDNLPGLAYAITHNKQRSVRDYKPDLPPAITRIVNKAMHKDSENRFADAGVMADNLRKASKKVSESSV